MTVAAVATPVSGALGDLIGRRKAFLWAGTLTTTLGSVTCALADSYPMLDAVLPEWRGTLLTHRGAGFAVHQVSSMA